MASVEGPCAGMHRFYGVQFDPSATCDSGGCLTLDECGECGGLVPGLHGLTVRNYDPGASCDDGSSLLNDALACVEGHVPKTPMPMAFATCAQSLTDIGLK